mgnify:CR=1 FL=1
MASILYKWFFVAAFSLLSAGSNVHPIFVSVVEIEHNATDKTLEVSCKIFTDDFEKALRNQYKTHIDLFNPSNKAVVDKCVAGYIQKHVQLIFNNRLVVLKYIGYEKEEESIWSYFEVANVPLPHNITVQNSLLYETTHEQVNMIRVQINSIEKIDRLAYPDVKKAFSF